VTYVALAEAAIIVLLLVVQLALVNVVRAQNRAHERRADLLTDKVLHLAGRTWTPPPSEPFEPNILARELEHELIEPEQETNY
jgi:hypothetical protein